MILSFLLVISCKVKTQPKSTLENFLIPLKIGPTSRSDYQLKRGNHKLSFNYSNELQAEIIKIDHKEILQIALDSTKNYLYEVFNDEFLIISEYTNRNASGIEYMLRKNMFFIALKDEKTLAQLSNNPPLRIVMSKEILDYYLNSKNHMVFRITNISKDSLFLMRHDGQKDSCVLKPLKIPYRVNH